MRPPSPPSPRRWMFAAAAVQVWQDEQLPEERQPAAATAAAAPSTWLTQEAHGRSLQQQLMREQATCEWLIKRWAVLNIDTLLAVLLFAVVMATPGALSLAVLAVAVAWALLATWGRRSSRQPLGLAGNGAGEAYAPLPGSSKPQEGAATADSPRVNRASWRACCSGLVQSVLMVALLAWVLLEYLTQASARQGGTPGTRNDQMYVNVLAPPALVARGTGTRMT